MTQRSSADRWLPLAATVIVLAALALRLFRADAQSLWYDEGTSVALAARGLAQIARDAANDIHPPLYYWLLALWTRLLGDGVVAIRSLSALVGTAVVAMVIVLGRRLLDARAGLAAGALAAVSPYLVWYSQEVRMYVLVALWACLLVYVALRLAEAEPGRRLRPVDVDRPRRRRGHGRPLHPVPGRCRGAGCWRGSRAAAGRRRLAH